MLYSWVPGSTKRIAQLTGDYDPEGFPHYTNTVEWGVVGVDGAANTEFDGRIFIFFGDGDEQNRDPIAFIEDAPLPRGAHLAIGQRGQRQLDAFFIGTDGALYVTWVIDGEGWRGPVRIGPRGVAPPGAPVATVNQTTDQTDVFFIGNNGALHVAWVGASGNWQGPAAIGPAQLAKPGAHVGTAKRTDDELYIIYFGKSGQMCSHRVIGTSAWPAMPDFVGPQHPELSGAWLVSILQAERQLTALFIGHDHKLNAYFINDAQNWAGPISIGLTSNVAPPGGGLAVVKQNSTLTTAVFFGHDGRLRVQFVVGTGAWSEPIPVAGPAAAGAGDTVACVVRPAQDSRASRTRAIFVNAKGHLMEYRVDGTDSWTGPHAVVLDAGALQGSSVVAARQGGRQTTLLHGGASDELNVSWVSDQSERWKGPVRINELMVKLFPVMKDGKFSPFEMQQGDAPSVALGLDSTPEGAFTFERSVYVFIFRAGEILTSSLTKSDQPGEAKPFKFLFDFSNNKPGSGRFWHIAPYRVRSAELPSIPGNQQEGVILFGMGRSGNDNHPWGVHLAWLPLFPGRDPILKDIGYYGGNGPNDWVEQERDASPLFYTKYAWASLSVGRIPGTGHWILLYHRAGLRSDADTRSRADEAIVARIAPTPWEVGSADEIVLVDPFRDGAFDKRSNYMYRPGQPDPRNIEARGGPFKEEGGELVGVHPPFLYGPGLLNRYTRVDPATNIVTLHFLVSTGWPYQVQLMRTEIQPARLFMSNVP